MQCANIVVQDGRPESTGSLRPLVSDLLDGLQVRDEENVTVYKYDWLGGARARTMRRPRTLSQLPRADSDDAKQPAGTATPLGNPSENEPDIHMDCMYVYSLLLPIASYTWKKTLAIAFAEGDAATSSHIASTTLFCIGEVSSRPEFQNVFRIMSNRPVVQWLTDFEDVLPSCWDFHSSTIKRSAFATILRKETLNYVSFFILCLLGIGLPHAQSVMKSTLVSFVTAIWEPI